MSVVIHPGPVTAGGCAQCPEEQRGHQVPLPCLPQSPSVGMEDGPSLASWWGPGRYWSLTCTGSTGWGLAFGAPLCLGQADGPLWAEGAVQSEVWLHLPRGWLVPRALGVFISGHLLRSRKCLRGALAGGSRKSRSEKSLRKSWGVGLRSRGGVACG